MQEGQVLHDSKALLNLYRFSQIPIQALVMDARLHHKSLNMAEDSEDRL